MVAHPVATADAAALDRLIGCVPRWVDQTTAGQASGCDRDVLLHAGPAFSDVRAISRPVLNSARVAAVYEGLADDFKTAEEASFARGHTTEAGTGLPYRDTPCFRGLDVHAGA